MGKLKKWRTIKAVAKAFKDADNETCITEYFLRGLVTNGMIPSARAGRKYLVSVEDVEAYLNGGGGNGKEKSHA